jgi:hypothetical protein
MNKNKKLLFEILLASIAICIVVPTGALAAFGPSEIIDSYSFNIGSISLLAGTGSTSLITSPPSNVYLQPGPVYDLHATVFNGGLCTGTLDTNITHSNFGPGIQICVYVENITSGSAANPTHNDGPHVGDIILGEGGSKTLAASTTINWITASDFNPSGSNPNPQWINILTPLLGNTPNGIMHPGDTYAIHYLFNILDSATQGGSAAFEGTYELYENVT